MAIAYDNSASYTPTSSNAVAVDYTCWSWDNRIMFVFTTGSNSSVSWVKFWWTSGSDWTAMTKITDVETWSNIWSLRYLINPTSWTKKLYVTSNNWFIAFGASSYSWVAQTSPINVSWTETSTNTSHAISVTTTVDNCWTVMGTCITKTNTYTLSPKAWTTTRQWNVDNASALWLFDSNWPKTPAWATSLWYDISRSFTTWQIASAFKPYVVSWPANVKTVNWLAKASVKTINWLALASVKTFNWLA